MVPEQNEPGILQLALSDLAYAITLAPEDPDAYYLRAQVNLILNQPQNALSDITKVINLAPQEADAYKQRFLCNLACGHRLDAAKDWLACCQLDSNVTMDAVMVLKSAAVENYNAADWN